MALIDMDYAFTNFAHLPYMTKFDAHNNALVDRKQIRYNEIKGDYYRYIEHGYDENKALVESQKGGSSIDGKTLYLFSHKEEFSKHDGPYDPNIMEVSVKKNGDVIVFCTTDHIVHGKTSEKTFVNAKFEYDPTSEALGSMLCGMGDPYELIMGKGQKALDLFKQTGLRPAYVRFDIGDNIYEADEKDIGLVSHSNFLGPQTSTIVHLNINDDKDPTNKEIDMTAQIAGNQVMDMIGQNISEFKNYLNECRELYNLPQFNEKVFANLQEGPAECVPEDEENYEQ